MKYSDNDNIEQQNYITEFPKTQPITILQMQRLLHPNVVVYIKPSNHKLYWKGEAIYIPSSLYNCEIRDMSLRRSDDEEPYKYGSVGVFIEKVDFWEEIADKNEINEINDFYLNLNTQEGLKSLFEESELKIQEERIINEIQ